MNKMKNYIKAFVLYTQIPFAISNGEKQRLFKKIKGLIFNIN